MNSSGKVMTVFIVIIAILLISLTAISLFFFQKERDLRKLTERKLEQSIASEIKLDSELKDTKKQNKILVEKNKEIDERINSLLDELELETGLKEELKKENMSLKDQLDKAIAAKNEIQKDIDKLVSDAKKRAADLETQLKEEIARRQKVEEQLKTITSKRENLEEVLSKVSSDPTAQDKLDKIINEPLFDKNEVNLDKIVVVPNEIPEGRILSVDTEVEFVIIDIGSKDGVKVGMILSVYRGQDYLGDIRVTRVQPGMAAADFIPPFSSRLVQKNDQVIIKE